MLARETKSEQKWRFRVQGFGLLEGLGDSVSRLKVGLDGPQLGV